MGLKDEVDEITTPITFSNIDQKSQFKFSLKAYLKVIKIVII